MLTLMRLHIDKAEVHRQLQRVAEAVIDDELLAGIKAATESEMDSDSSEVTEVVFATPISPPRSTAPLLARTVTPESSRKRNITLVMRMPDKPRAVPVPHSTP